MATDPSALQAMAQGLSSRVPLSQLGLAGPAPNAQNPRGGMPGGLDPLAQMFRSLEEALSQASSALQREGRPKSLRMGNELDGMAVKVNRMMIEHQAEMAPAAGAPPSAAPAMPNINAGGIL